MTNWKTRLAKLLVVPLVAFGGVVAVQSPAFAGCQAVSFTFKGNPQSWSCSGTFTPSGIPVYGYRSTGWGGYFVYQGVEPVFGPPDQIHYFCDQEDVTLPVVEVPGWPPEPNQWVQVEISVSTLYLAATRPSWC